MGSVRHGLRREKSCLWLPRFFLSCQQRTSAEHPYNSFGTVCWGFFRYASSEYLKTKSFSKNALCFIKMC